jgi:hypothetical protein
MVVIKEQDGVLDVLLEVETARWSEQAYICALVRHCSLLLEGGGSKVL